MSDLRNTVQPGDIINTSGFKFDWKHPFESLKIKGAVDIIKKTQKEVFGETIKSKRLRTDDSHSVMYFGPEHIISTEMPKPLWIPLSTYEGKDIRRISVYRMNPAYFQKTLTPTDTDMMREIAQSIIDRNVQYDIGQLVDILITTIAGYPWEKKVNWFDQGSQRLVCSVTVASIIAAWRHKVKETTGQDIPQPWKKLNPLAWSERTISKYPGHWDIETTFPANYAMTDTHFQNEFILVGQFKGGKRIA